MEEKERFDPGHPGGCREVGKAPRRLEWPAACGRPSELITDVKPETPCILIQGIFLQTEMKDKWLSIDVRTSHHGAVDSYWEIRRALFTALQENV